MHFPNPKTVFAATLLRSNLPNMVFRSNLPNMELRSLPPSVGKNRSLRTKTIQLNIGRMLLPTEMVRFVKPQEKSLL